MHDKDHFEFKRAMANFNDKESLLLDYLQTIVTLLEGISDKLAKEELKTTIQPPGANKGPMPSSPPLGMRPIN